MRLNSFARQPLQMSLVTISLWSIGNVAQQIAAPDWAAGMVIATIESATIVPINQSSIDDEQLFWNQSSAAIEGVATENESDPASMASVAMVEDNSMKAEVVVNQTDRLVLSRIRQFESLLDQISTISNRQQCDSSAQPSTIRSSTISSVPSVAGYRPAKQVAPQRISLPWEANRLLQPQLQAHLMLILNRLRLLAVLLSEYQTTREQLEMLLNTAMGRLRDANVLQVRAALISDVMPTKMTSSDPSTMDTDESSFVLLASLLLLLHTPTQTRAIEQRNVSIDLNVPWLRFGPQLENAKRDTLHRRLLRQGWTQVSTDEWPSETNVADWPSRWTDVQFDCDTNRWLVSVEAIMLRRENPRLMAPGTSRQTSDLLMTKLRLIGLLSVDIELVGLDLDQCATFSLPQHLWQPSEDLLQDVTLLLQDNRTSAYVPVALSADNLFQLSEGSWTLEPTTVVQPNLSSLDSSSISTTGNVDDSLDKGQQQDPLTNDQQQRLRQQKWTSALVTVLGRRLRVSGAEPAVGRLVLALPETHKCHRPSSQASR